jgi:glycosyltransferase involved in cell wall biosynthesis
VEPAYAAALQAEITRLGLGPQVRLVGFAEPWPFYEAADLFVFASVEEGFGTVVLEAMAAGLPVVVRRLSGVNESFIEHGVSGFLFDDADGFRNEVAHLLGDPELRERIGGQARAAAAGFDIQRAAARYLDLYEPAGQRP